MSQILKQARNLLVVSGVALLLVSFILNPGLAENTDVVVGPDDCHGFLLSLGGSLTLIAGEVEGKLFSLYILTYEDTLMCLQKSSVNQTSPVLFRENITFISETVSIIFPGTYGILVFPVENETVTVGITIGRVLPQLGIVLYGIVLITAGVFFELIKHFPRTKVSFDI